MKYWPWVVCDKKIYVLCMGLCLEKYGPQQGMGCKFTPRVRWKMARVLRDLHYVE